MDGSRIFLRSVSGLSNPILNHSNHGYNYSDNPCAKQNTGLSSTTEIRFCCQQGSPHEDRLTYCTSPKRFFTAKLHFGGKWTRRKILSDLHRF